MMEDLTPEQIAMLEKLHDKSMSDVPEQAALARYLKALGPVMERFVNEEIDRGTEMKVILTALMNGMGVQLSSIFGFVVSDENLDQFAEGVADDMRAIILMNFKNDAEDAQDHLKELEE